MILSSILKGIKNTHEESYVSMYYLHPV